MITIIHGDIKIATEIFEPHAFGEATIGTTELFIIGLGRYNNFFLKLLMCIFKLLIQIQISLIIGNLYQADKVTQIVNKTITKKISLRNNTSPYTMKLDVRCNYSS